MSSTPMHGAPWLKVLVIGLSTALLRCEWKETPVSLAVCTLVEDSNAQVTSQRGSGAPGLIPGRL